MKQPRTIDQMVKAKRRTKKTLVYVEEMKLLMARMKATGRKGQADELRELLRKHLLK